MTRLYCPGFKSLKANAAVGPERPNAEWGATQASNRAGGDNGSASSRKRRVDFSSWFGVSGYSRRGPTA